MSENNCNIEEPTTKRQRLEEEEKSEKKPNGNQSEKKPFNLSKLRFDRVLLSDNSSRRIVLKVVPDDEEDGNDGMFGILDISKEPFDADKLFSAGRFAVGNQLEPTISNDIYRTFLINENSLEPTANPPSFSETKVISIYPATAKHLTKYSEFNAVIIEETADVYRKVTEPFVRRNRLSHDWIYNILDHKTESERIVFEDPHPENGFILLPDMKWVQQDIESGKVAAERFYLMAVCHRRDLMSVRCLRRRHLPLLRNIREQSLRVVRERFGFGANQLRLYFHYHPSYWHLHVHVVHVKNPIGGDTVSKAILLSDVIQLLEFCPAVDGSAVDAQEAITLQEREYFGNATLTIQLRDTDQLCTELVRATST